MSTHTKTTILSLPGHMHPVYTQTDNYVRGVVGALKWCYTHATFQTTNVVMMITITRRTDPTITPTAMETTLLPTNKISFE